MISDSLIKWLYGEKCQHHGKQSYSRMMPCAIYFVIEDGGARWGVLESFTEQVRLIRRGLNVRRNLFRSHTFKSKCDLFIRKSISVGQRRYSPLQKIMEDQRGKCLCVRWLTDWIDLLGIPWISFETRGRVYIYSVGNYDFLSICSAFSFSYPTLKVSNNIATSIMQGLMINLTLSLLRVLQSIWCILLSN